MNRPRSAAMLAIACCLLSPSGAGRAVAQLGPPQVGAITSITDPLIRQVVQRRDDNIGRIFVAGTYSGDVDGFQASSTLMPGTKGTPLGWTPLVDVTIFEGFFVGIFRQPAGGFYNIQVRPTYQGQVGQPLTVLAVGVGEVFITAGQSNSTNWGTPTNYVPSVLVSCFDDGPWAGTDTFYRYSSWRWAVDPQPALDGSTMGSVWPTMATELSNALGLPVGLYAAGYVGTSIENWLPGSVLVPGTSTQPQIELFGRLINGIEYFNGRGGFRAVLWVQGETDYSKDTDPSVYRSELAVIIEESRQSTGLPVKWMVARTTTPLTTNLAEKVALEQAQAAVVDNVLTFPGPDLDSIGLPFRLYQNNFPVHFNAAGLELLGGYWAIYVYNLRGFLAPGNLP